MHIDSRNIFSAEYPEEVKQEFIQIYISFQNFLKYPDDVGIFYTCISYIKQFISKKDKYYAGRCLACGFTEIGEVNTLINMNIFEQTFGIRQKQLKKCFVSIGYKYNTVGYMKDELQKYIKDPQLKKQIQINKWKLFQKDRIPSFIYICQQFDVRIEDS